MNSKVLNAVKYIGGTILAIGIIIFSLGFFVSDSSTLISLGIGTVMGAVFIFLMGVFFVATEEMFKKTHKGTEIVSTKMK